MTGTSTATLRVTHLNANWTPAATGDGTFALLVVTEDGGRRTTSISAGDLTALASIVRDGVVLLWDPEDDVLVIGNLLGRWIPLDWSGRVPRA